MTQPSSSSGYGFPPPPPPPPPPPVLPTVTALEEARASPTWALVNAARSGAPKAQDFIEVKDDPDDVYVKVETKVEVIQRRAKVEEGQDKFWRPVPKVKAEEASKRMSASKAMPRSKKAKVETGRQEGCDTEKAEVEGGGTEKAKVDGKKPKVETRAQVIEGSGKVTPPIGEEEVSSSPVMAKAVDESSDEEMDVKRFFRVQRSLLDPNAEALSL